MTPGMLLILMVWLAILQQDPYTYPREKMVQEQIIARGVADTATLRAMRTVPRHLFVPLSLRGSAYADYPLPIGHGQTISQPYIVAYMTSVIDPASCKKVLEIGTGSGYQAAVLAEIADSVFTIEIIPELAESAGLLLGNLGYGNILVKQGDGYAGWKEHAPFDAIIVTAAPEQIPQPLIDQLKEGGRMVIPVGSVFDIQSLTLVTKTGSRIHKENLMPVRFVPFLREN